MSTAKKNQTMMMLLPSVGLLMGYLFALGNNAFSFEKSALFVSLSIAILAAAALFAINRIATKFLSKVLPNSIFPLLICLFFACQIVFCAWCLVWYGTIPYKLKLWAPVLTGIVFLFLYKKKSHIILVFFLVMIVFSTITFIKNSFFNPELTASNLTQSNISFNKKPNIYLFWLESYHSFDILKSVYNIDNAEFQHFLARNNFTIVNETYSSGSHTLQSFVQLYSCRSLPTGIFKGNLDGPLALRNLIGGDINNFVLKTLKENGYRTTMLVEGSNYYFYSKGMFLDETDFSVKSILNYIMPLLMVTHWKKDAFDDKKVDAAPYSGSLFERVKMAVERSKQSHAPYFIAFKGGAAHTSSDGDYTWKDNEQWVKSGVYQNLVKKADAETTEIINYLLKEDPNSIIVLLGDHGATRYRNFPQNETGEPSKSCQRYHVNLQDIFDDYFKVLFAYRLPQGEATDISSGLYMNNSNVFLHIFAWLAEDQEILKLRPPVESHIGEAKMIDGKKIHNQQ